MPDNDQDNQPLHGPNLILDVENFGPIAEARNVEFRPMTVFVGPSNTGKSYLAMLLHAILKAKNGDALRPDAVPPSVESFDRSIDQHRLNEIIFEIQSFLETRFRRRANSQIPMMRFASMSSKLQHLLVTATYSWLNSLATRSIDEVEYFFQRSLNDLTTSTSNYDALKVKVFTGSREWLMTIASDDYYKATTTLGYVGLIIDNRFQSALLRFHADNVSADRLVESRFIDALDASISWKMNAFIRSHYAPAGRTGIMASKSILTRTILANLNRAVVNGLEVGQLKPIVGEFLSSLHNDDEPNLRRGLTPSARPRSRRPRMTEVADLIEEGMLHGRIVKANRDFDDGSYNYESDSFRGPLESASSMVTEVAPLVLAIRNVVRKGELLIIDEPEAHLHPDSQQKMAAVLAYMVRRGIRVLVTTHSHYFVEQLGTFVNAGSDSVDPDERERHLRLLGREIDRDLYLKQDEVAVYEFEPRGQFGDPSIVTQLGWDDDLLGYFPLGYSKALVDQRNRNIHMIGAREGF